MDSRLVKAMEAVRNNLARLPGTPYKELERMSAKLASCGAGTVCQAIKLMREDGFIVTEKQGHKVLYFWNNKPADGQEDDILPVQRAVIPAIDAPRVSGARLNPIEWTAMALEAA